MMKSIIKSLLILLLFTTTAVSQNWTQPDPDPELEKQAIGVVDKWSQVLVMSPKQETLMKKVLIEFAMKKDEAIQSNLPKQEKSQIIIELQERQFADMRDILTDPQYEKYVKLSEEAIRRIDDRK